MKREVLVCHRTDRGLVGHEPCEVGADVRSTVLVPIERNRAAWLAWSRSDGERVIRVLGRSQESPPRHPKGSVEVVDVLRETVR